MDNNPFDFVKDVEVDAILKCAREYNADPSTKKINLSIGVCCNEDGTLHIFPSVLEAEKIIIKKYKEKPYMLPNNSADFCKKTQELIFGNDSKYMRDDKICTIQTIGGTGAIFIILELLKINEKIKKIYVTDIPYINHVNMIKSRGFELKYLRFFDSNILDINYTNFLKDLEEIENNSAIILQVSCYNPCSLDIKKEYFNNIADIVIKKNHLIVFDIAYQGFGSTDLNEDVALIRFFQDKNINFVVCQSFSKNMSLYGERGGALHIIGKDIEQKQKIHNNLCYIIRKFYSSPCIYTHRLICEVLLNEELKKIWIDDLKQLCIRIGNNRTLFFEKLNTYQKKFNLKYNWDVYKKQKGIFSFVPIFAKIHEQLKQKKHIYIIMNGRINISSITKNNVDYIAESICECLRDML
ncbi:aspartate transaminase, putative [Hepatocystis sp. ex Piliocolobus tephrosceles]|nr:aspartate transaminase, putative [Hepatocystis sp. ex Piliocolobus tephrosceles]